MSQFSPNPFNNVSGNYSGQQSLNQNPMMSSHSNLTQPKEDANSNSPAHLPNHSNVQTGLYHNVNNYNQSSNSSPAFNHPGILTSSNNIPSSMLPPIKPIPTSVPSNQFFASSLSNPNPINNSSPYPPNYVAPSNRQINANAPPLIPSSQYNQPYTNGPSNFLEPPTSAPFQNPPSSKDIISLPVGGINKQMGTVSNQPNIPFSASSIQATQRNSPLLQGGGPSSQTVNGPPQVQLKGGAINSATSLQLSGTMNAPKFDGPFTTGGQNFTSSTVQSSSPFQSSLTNKMGTGSGVQLPASSLQSGPTGMQAPPQRVSTLMPSGLQSGLGALQSGPSSFQTGPPGLLSGPPGLQSGPTGLRTGPSGLQTGPPGLQTGPPGLQSGPPGLQSGPLSLPSRPPGSQSGPPGLQSGPQGLQIQNALPGLQSGPPGLQTGPTSLQSPGPHRNQQYMPNLSGPVGLQSGPMSMPPTNMQPSSMGPIHSQPGLPSGPQVPMPSVSGPVSNVQNRYPPMPQSNYSQQQAGQQIPQRTYPPQQCTAGITQQIGSLSVTKQGFDQLWGHQNVDLLQCRHILPEYPEDPPEIRLGNHFADAPNCSPEIFRCTINKIPETNNLLQKSRLPLGILIHPFKDLNHLPVIQCASIVRCRACRTYINPFVYFLDSKRWKCNLCYRVNDLPEEFQYDPVSKSYGDPSRRPEIKSATIEFIAPAEYMLRPPQPAVYLFLLDVSHIARESGYLDVLCKTLKGCLDQLPGDARTQVGFICYDSHIHYYLMNEASTRPKEMTVLDVDDIFLPSPESLLVNMGERKDLINELLTVLPKRFSGPGSPGSALGAALQAAYKLMAPTGGRITVFQTCLPNAGPGALQPREDPNARSSKDVAHLNPATDFYKRLALDCSGAQISVDLFLLNSQYSDLATLSGMSKFSAGSVYHIPLFNGNRIWQADQFTRMLNRYFTRKIGFEAVMRVRCTRGIGIHTFHGNFFVRSTDLLSLPNVSPDVGFGMQLTIEESLADLQQVCFQAALLYTSSKGERRIRVHTLALPIANTLPDVLYSADQQCIIGLLSKMAVDRCVSASMSEAKEALINVAIDALSAHKLAQNLPAGTVSTSLYAPASLRLLPLYLLALLKRKAFRTGTSTRLDDRVSDMCDMKSLPLSSLLRRVYPDLYPLHSVATLVGDVRDVDVPRLPLSAERINSTGAYLLDDGETMIIYVGHAVSPAFLSDTFGVASFNQLPDEARSIIQFESDGNEMLHAFIDKLNDDRPYPSNILLLRDNSPSRTLFTERLVEDRVESAFSYYEFLQHIKNQVK